MTYIVAEEVNLLVLLCLFCQVLANNYNAHVICCFPHCAILMTSFTKINIVAEVNLLVRTICWDPFYCVYFARCWLTPITMPMLRAVSSLWHFTCISLNIVTEVVNLLVRTRTRLKLLYSGKYWQELLHLAECSKNVPEMLEVIGMESNHTAHEIRPYLTWNPAIPRMESDLYCTWNPTMPHMESSHTSHGIQPILHMESDHTSHGIQKCLA